MSVSMDCSKLMLSLPLWPLIDGARSSLVDAFKRDEIRCDAIR